MNNKALEWILRLTGGAICLCFFIYISDSPVLSLFSITGGLVGYYLPKDYNANSSDNNDIKTKLRSWLLCLTAGGLGMYYFFVIKDDLLLFIISGVVCFCIGYYGSSQKIFSQETSDPDPIS